MDAAVRPSNSQADTATTTRSAEHPFVVPGPVVGPNPVTTQLPVPHADQSPGTSSSTTTLPRLASVHVSQNGSRDGSQPWGVNGPGERQPDVANTIGVTRLSSESFSGNVLHGEAMAEQEVVVLTPSRLRLDSRVVLAHATLQWLTNAVWAVLIWQKLDGVISCSWWVVFSPTIFNHVLHIPMQIIVMMLANHMVYKQIGPPPPLSASPGLVLQYAIIHHVRIRSHRVDWANNAMESGAVFIVKLLFCDALHRGTLESTSLRLMFTPIWACWVTTFLLLCFKDRTERMFGSSRDLFFIFLLFVAFKVDDQSTYSWRVVFLVPWMWFSGMLLVAGIVLLLLLFAKVWARPRELLLPIGFMLLLLASLPQFLSYIALVRRLDGDLDTSIKSIMWPNALSWLLMWFASLVIAHALRLKEAVRDSLLARGAVWTAHEAVARRLHAERDEAQRRVDELSEDEVSRLVQSMMAGKTKPGRLRRVGENLYKRIASLEPALAEQAAQSALLAASLGSSTHGSGLEPGRQSATELRRTSTSGDVGSASGLPHYQRLGSGVVKYNRVVPTGALEAAEGVGGAASSRSGRWLAVGGGAPGEVRAVELQRLDEDRDLESGEESFRIGTRVFPDDRNNPNNNDNNQQQPLQTRSSQSGRTGSGASSLAAGPGGSLRTPPVSTIAGGQQHGVVQRRARAAAPLGRPPTLESQSSLPPRPGSTAGAVTAAESLRGGADQQGRSEASVAPRAGTPAESPGLSGVGVRGASSTRGDVAITTNPDSESSSSATSRLPGPEGAAGGAAAGIGAAGGRGAGGPLSGSELRVAGVSGAARGESGCGGETAARPGGSRGGDDSGGQLQVEEEAEGVVASSSPRRAPAVLPVGEVEAAVGDDTAVPARAAPEAGGSGGGSSSAPTRAEGGSMVGGVGVGDAGAADGGGTAAAAAGNDGGSEADNVCVICYDNEASCVFLECGHGGFCRRCAYLLFVRPPNECPTCRAVIDQVVEIDGAAPVGEVATVK